jgi:hypothetical protein
MKCNQRLLCFLLFAILAAACRRDKAESRIVGNTWALRSQTLVGSSTNPVHHVNSHWSTGTNDLLLRLNHNGSFNFKYNILLIPNSFINGPQLPTIVPVPKEEVSAYRFAGDSVYIVAATDTVLIRLLYGGLRFPANRWPHGESIFLHQVGRDSMVSKFQWDSRIYDQLRNDSITVNYAATTGFRRI